MTTVTVGAQQKGTEGPVVRFDVRKLQALASLSISRAWCVLRNLFHVRPGDEQFVDLLASPAIAAIIAFCALSLGTLVSVFGGEMRGAMQRMSRVNWFDQATYLPMHWLTVLFWINLFLWTRLLYLRLHVEQALRERRIKILDNHVIELRGAIFRAYNPAVINAYQEQFERTVAGMRKAILVTQESGPAVQSRAREIELQVQVVLRAALTLAAEFSYAKAEEFEVNVMLFAPQTAEGFPEPVLESLVFFDDGRDLAKLKGILYTTRELMHYPGGEPWIPVIALPVPDIKPKSGVLVPPGENLVLPGAPHAFITGVPNVYEDTRNLYHDYPDLDASVRREMHSYFGEDGRGQRVRSFASFRIGGEPGVGVLNLSRVRENVLGERQYYTTFHALIAPYLYLLETLLHDHSPEWKSAGGIGLAGRSAASD